MHFKCVDNGSKHICNVTQSIVKTLTTFNKCLRMDEKCFSMRWQLFPTVDPNAAQTLNTKDVSFPTKLTLTLTQPIALCLHATNIQLKIKILHLGEFDFV